LSRRSSHSAREFGTVGVLTDTSTAVIMMTTAVAARRIVARGALTGVTVFEPIL
jgi:hypothetical protein